MRTQQSIFLYLVWRAVSVLADLKWFGLFLMPLSIPVINLEETNVEKPVVWDYWLGNIQVMKCKVQI